MNRAHCKSKPSERGVALLISIFALILISGVAITLITMSGTESALSANYKRNTAAYLAAKSGIEEARERLVPCAPDTLWPATMCTAQTSADFLFNMNPAVANAKIVYLMNPGGADEIVYNPANPTSGRFYDFQFVQEYGQAALPLQAGATIIQRAANSPLPGFQAGLAPINYKWVRINLKTEMMGGVDLNNDGAANNQILPVRAMGNDVQCMSGTPNCTADPNAVVTSSPVFRVTALAIDPFGAERMVQAELALPPTFNPNGAISSEAGVDLQGNFNAFGAWPPIVEGKCGGKTVKTCGKFDKNVQPDCTNLYDQATDTCNGRPRSKKDYCGTGNAVNGVASAGEINSGNYNEVPDTGTECKENGPGCIFTNSPQQALSPNTPDWPYDMDEIIQLYAPPASQEIEQVAKEYNTSVTCGAFDANGNRKCAGQDSSLGKLPSTWPVPPGTTTTDAKTEVTYAKTGPDGLLKLTGGSSGAGVLIVEGDLEIQGGFQWYGLIIVHGVVTFLGGGSTGTNIIGGVLAGKSVTNAAATTDVGGSVSITYSSCAYRPNIGELPLRYLGFREVVRPRPANP